MSKKPANNLFKDKTNVYVTECLSTNDFLMQLSLKNSIEEGSVVITDFQTKGKGQRKAFIFIDCDFTIFKTNSS